MKKNKILFIIPWLPYPLKSGGHQALFNGIYAVRNDFEVHIAYKVENDNDYLNNEKMFLELIPNANLYPLCCDVTYPVWRKIASRVKKAVKGVLGMIDGKVENDKYAMCERWISTISPMQKEWLEHVSNICKKNQFDIIQVEMPWYVSQILTLPRESNIIYVHHELGFVRRELEQKQTILDDYIRACKSFADYAEIGLLNMYNAVVTLSPIDKKKLECHGVTVPVYSSFATINLSNNFECRTSDGLQLSFVGPDSHSPNLVGINWFLNNCWDKLKKGNSSYKLKIIGKWEEKHITELTSKYPDVEFLGYVDDLTEAIQDTVMIVPITIGSGIRMKILEACSTGVPFVSTSVGAEGIPVVSGKHCFLADKPNDFVSCLVRLQDPGLQKEFVLEARKMVEINYSVEALRKNRMNIYNDVLGKFLS